MNSRVYLSGPMTGLPDHNFPAFNEVAAALRAGGRTVFNPAESFDGKTDLSRREYFQHDFTELDKCSVVALLPGWEKSEGALSEVFAALQMQLPIFRVVGATHQLESVPPFEIMDALVEFGIRWMEGKTIVGKTTEPGTDEAGTFVGTSETILEEAARLTSGDRNKDYGHPLDDYAKTGIIWGALLHTWAKEAAKHEYPIPVPADLACLLMVGVKLSRQVNRRKRDNLVDGAGYLRCVEMIEVEQERRNAER